MKSYEKIRFWFIGLIKELFKRIIKIDIEKRNRKIKIKSKSTTKIINFYKFILYWWRSSYFQFNFGNNLSNWNWFNSFGFRFHYFFTSNRLSMKFSFPTRYFWFKIDYQCRKHWEVLINFFNTRTWWFFLIFYTFWW